MEIKESNYIRSFVVITLKSLKTPVILKPYNQAHMSGSNDLVRTYLDALAELKEQLLNKK